MNVSVILAGGTGSRLNADIPKQYLEVQNKPVIVHTLEVFQNTDIIDAVEVVCAESYTEHVTALLKRHNLTKVRWIAPGGNTCQESIKKGIYALQDRCSEDDIVMINMSVSPMVTARSLTEAVRLAKEKGNAFAALPCLFCMCKKGASDDYSDENAFKEDYWELNMPWAFRYGEIRSLYREADKKGIGTGIKSYTPSLMFELGRRVYTYRDDDINRLKITTKADLALFDAWLYLRNKKMLKTEETNIG